MTGNMEAVCYEFLKINKKRVIDGLETSPVTSSDF